MTNFDNLKFIDGDFLNSDSISDMIYENEGSFTEKDQSMTFEIDQDTDVTVNFEVYVEGSINEDFGDYFTPGSCDVEVTDIDVTINQVFVNDVLVNLDSQSLNKIEKLIKYQLS
jgi:hypothetical protein